MGGLDVRQPRPPAFRRRTETHRLPDIRHGIIMICVGTCVRHGLLNGLVDLLIGRLRLRCRMCVSIAQTQVLSTVLWNMRNAVFEMHASPFTARHLVSERCRLHLPT